jgi:hypothetical protein
VIHLFFQTPEGLEHGFVLLRFRSPATPVRIACTRFVGLELGSRTPFTSAWTSLRSFCSIGFYPALVHSLHYDICCALHWPFYLRSVRTSTQTSGRNETRFAVVSQVSWSVISPPSPLPGCSCSALDWCIKFTSPLSWFLSSDLFTLAKPMRQRR